MDEIQTYNTEASKNIWSPTELPPAWEGFRLPPWSPDFTAAVRLFQEEHELKIDGKLGPQTYSELISQYSHALGVDVSHWSGEVDWAGLADLGVAFAFIKFTQGTTFADPLASDNWILAQDAGLIVSPFHVIEYTEPIDQQIRWFLAHLPGDYKQQIPPQLDIETSNLEEYNKANSVGLFPHPVNLTLEWLLGIRLAAGVNPGFYMSSRGAEEMGERVAELDDFALWLCSHHEHPFLTWRYWQFWQFGKLELGGQEFDANYYAGTVRELRARG